MEQNWIGVLIKFLILSIVVGVIIELIREHFKAKSKIRYPNKALNAWHLIPVLALAISTVSFVLNCGLIRFILAITFMLPIYGIAYFVINIKAAYRVKTFNQLKKYIILSSVTFILAHVLCPDDGEFGEMFFLFGLFENNNIATILLYITYALFAASIVFLVLEALAIRKCNKISNKIEQ